MVSPIIVKLRFAFLQTLVVVAFAVLTARVWYLQMVHGEEYRLAADYNRFRMQTIDAPRGIIYDHKGRLLVQNEPTFTIAVVPGDLPAGMEDAVLTRLSTLLGIPVSTQPGGSQVGQATNPTRPAPHPEVGAQESGGAEEQGSNAPSSSASAGIREMIEQGIARGGRYAAVPIKSRVERDVAFRVAEEHLALPGVRVLIEPVRRYFAGPLLGHILGYLGRIPAERTKEYIGRDDYEVFDRVGLAGIEASYEDELRGTKGRKLIEVDVLGREVRTIGDPLPPVAGHNLILSIDIDLQEAVEAALKKGMARVKSKSGVAIAMDPQTGRILAMVSLPAYDNNLFSGGISSTDWASLNTPEQPMFNRAIGGLYPTGSTFKIITASAGLQEGVINRNTTLVDTGVMYVASEYDPSVRAAFYGWYRPGLGPVNVVTALERSSDIFFYQVGGGFPETGFQGLGQKRLAEYARLFGFGAPTGIDLPGEAEGLVPDDKWKRHTVGEVWYLGDTYNMSIGQGYFLATPLQLLNATAAVANGGTLYRPQLVERIEDGQGKVVHEFTPKVIRQLPIAPEHLSLVRQGMRAAVAGAAGTARFAGLPAEVEVAGKTGTAEFAGPKTKDGHQPTHAWFTAFAPYQNPEIALIVFVDGHGVGEVIEGSAVAAPIAAEILRAYFHLPPPATEIPLQHLGDR